MTKWPLICEDCGAEVYIGSLYGGMCKECHMADTLARLDARTQADEANQSALGDFA